MVRDLTFTQSTVCGSSFKMDFIFNFRKYKTQIEEYIKGLLDQEAREPYETMMKLDLKVGPGPVFNISLSWNLTF